MKRTKLVRFAAAAAMVMWITAVPGLRAQEGQAGASSSSFAEGRILRTDGEKIRVASFVLESSRVAYRLGASAEPSFLDLAEVGSLQVRRPTTFGRTARSFLLGAFVGVVVGLIVADRWGGPTKGTWPGIGAGAVLFGGIGAVLELTIRRYETVYSNPDFVPKKIIKLEMGAVAPRTPGVSLSISY